jgi:hypothetical protein
VIVGAENTAFRLMIMERTSQAVVWDDHAEANWTGGGTVARLSKRLHDELKRQTMTRRY